MDKLFQNQYRIESSRLPDWDYTNTGLYFVTLCTHSHKCYFGEVISDQMHLNQLGEIVNDQIRKTKVIRSNVTIDKWVIMPNHIHMIIYLHNEDNVETPRRGVSTETINHWKPNCLGSIVNHLKGAITKQIRAGLDPHFSWQARFYDHIIRTEQDLENLRLYIDNNPTNWVKDRSENKPVEAITHA